MKILTFDTSFDRTFVTLGEDDNIIASSTINSHDNRYHSAFLIPEIVKILKENNLKMQDVGAIGINAGPGSFTGIRICNTVGRVTAGQLNIPLINIPSLHIISKIVKGDNMVAVLMNARKNKAYAGVYSVNKEIKSPFALNLDDFDEFAKDFDGIFVTDTFMHDFLKERGRESINFETSDEDFGKYLYELTVYKLKEGGENLWINAKPLYIQPPSITISKKAVVK